MASARVDEEIKRDNISEENLLLQEDARKNDIKIMMLRLRGIRAPHTCLECNSRQGFVRILKHIKYVI